TRYELAGILARFLEHLEGKSEVQLTPEENELVERLRREFAAELKMQKDRTAALEVQLREVQGELAQLKKENQELKEQLNRALREVASVKTEVTRLNAAGGQDIRARLDQQESSTRRLYLFLAVVAVAALIK
ncbi:MAG: hypothetical protein QJR13_09585, partial [Bacillota bacterium]|nr:hypothetical protein [Bacillota bacterium]